MVHVVYFNQFFSSIVGVIKSLKGLFGSSIRIVASSKNKDHVYKYVVDKFIVEDWEDKLGVNDGTEEAELAYIEWLEKIFKEECVDLMFAKSHLTELSKYKERIKDTRVNICVDLESIDMLDSKHGTFKYLQSNLNDNYKHIIPNEAYVEYDAGSSMYKVDRLETCACGRGELKYGRDDMFDMLKSAGMRDCRKLFGIEQKKQICLKMDRGEGGVSFRKVGIKPSINSLYKFRTNEITTDELVDIVLGLLSRPSLGLSLMEYLDEPEISVDCYDSSEGFIAIAREKQAGTRVQRIYSDGFLRNACMNIGKAFNLKNIFNVQFRTVVGGDSNCSKDIRLLEINPRISGGAHYEVAAGSGMNLCALRIIDALDLKGERFEQEFIKCLFLGEHKVTYVEQAISL